MEIKQSGAFGTVKTRFVFGAEKLEFSEEVGSALRSFAVPYEQIPVDHVTVASFSRHFVRLYLLGVLLAGAAVFGTMIAGAGPGNRAAGARNAAVAFVLVVLAARFFVRPRGRLTITVFKTPLGTIEVLDGETKTAVLNAIVDRRRAVVRAKYLRIDPANHPQREMDRFRALKSNGFITDGELAEALQKLSSAPPQGFPFPPAPPEEPNRPLS